MPDIKIQQPGRSQFLAQRARLQASLHAIRIRDTADRFDCLDETRKKVLFMLANDAASRVAGLPPLTRSHLGTLFTELGEREQTTLMLGIKRLAEFATALPWEFEDYAAPRAEVLAAREKPAEPEEQKDN